jgi:hypothetical protein
MCLIYFVNIFYNNNNNNNNNNYYYYYYYYITIIHVEEIYRMIMKNELGAMYEEFLVVYFKILSRHWPRGTAGGQTSS